MRWQIVTGGGTGTYDIDCDVPVVTDLQVGSYIFMDQQYLDVGGRGGDKLDDFEVALTVLTTAISQPVAGMITVDWRLQGVCVRIGRADSDRHAGDEISICRRRTRNAVARRGRAGTVVGSDHSLS